MAEQSEIQRQKTKTKAVVVGATSGAADEIDISKFAGGGFRIPFGSGLTSITVYLAVETGGTFIALGDGSSPIAVVADAYYPLPDAVYAQRRCGWSATRLEPPTC